MESHTLHKNPLVWALNVLCGMLVLAIEIAVVFGELMLFGDALCDKPFGFDVMTMV